VNERDPFQRYRARMAEAGFRPSSTLGQNFLLDPTLHRWIAERAEPTQADLVVEIGAGLGFLTRELIARAGRVVAVEIDARLLDIARGELACADNLSWVAGDALGGPGRTLHPAIREALAGAGGRRLIVANLPYSVSGPLLAELVAAFPPVDRAVLLVQKELALRTVAGPGSPDYGGLSVAVQAVFSARSLRDVPPQVFRPRPKVTSSIVQLDRRDDALPEFAGEAPRREFLSFVRHLFRHRRKVLRTTLSAAAAAIGQEPPALPEESLKSRAEEAAPDTVAGWWRAARGGA
jgi:16S rRNA (adenine1518-N6/adenine1519-N6)-dimethyltransferase